MYVCLFSLSIVMKIVIVWNNDEENCDHFIDLVEFVSRPLLSVRSSVRIWCMKLCLVANGYGLIESIKISLYQIFAMQSVYLIFSDNYNYTILWIITKYMFVILCHIHTLLHYTLRAITIMTKACPQCSEWLFYVLW